MFEIRNLGVYVLLAYAFYNMLNILYFHGHTPTLPIWIFLSGYFLVLRSLRLFNKNGGITQSEFVGLLLICLVAFIVMLQNIVHEPYVGGDGVETISNLTSLTIVSIVWFLIGCACSNFELRHSNSLAVVITLFVAAFMFFATDENLTIPFEEISAKSGLERVTHLTLEKHILLVCVFACALANKTRLVCVGVTAMALFFMGGRTALFVFVAAAVLLSIRGNTLFNLISICAISIIGVVLFQYGISSGYVDIESKAVRDILFLDGIEDDGSFQGRLTLYRDSLPLLADQVLIGNYSLSVERTGYFSGYIHNILSAWQFYGIFVFLAIILCLSYCARRMVVALKRESSVNNMFGALLLVYVIIGMVISKYAAWHLLWFILGFWLMKRPVVKGKKMRKKRRSKREAGFELVRQ